jgi:hypothetical protein
MTILNEDACDLRYFESVRQDTVTTCIVIGAKMALEE